MKNFLTVSSSPHIRHEDSTALIMGDVIIALLPAAIFGCIVFGIKSALILVVSVASCVLAEFLWNLILKKENSIFDLSAVVTGLLLGMNLSAETPVWIVPIGAIVAIIVVKQMFGGLGCNFANPAIAARIVLLVSFPAAMSRFDEPVSGIISSATPLVSDIEPSLKNLFFGIHSGCIGETSELLLLLGGIYLVMRRIIKPTIPLCFIGTVFVLTFAFGGNPVSEILKGGLFLGAIFMATDYTTSPGSFIGKIVFGICCGAITFVIRQFASLPEGVSYSILLMNILVPHIERIGKVKPFGMEVKNNG